MKTTELGLLLQVLLVRIIAFVETLGSHLKLQSNTGVFLMEQWFTQDNGPLVIY